MSYKVVLLKPLHESGINLLKANGCEVIISEGVTEEDYIRDIGDADAIFVRNEKITPRIMDACSSLKVIAKHGAGYENIDVDYATQRGIQVVYVPGGNAISVAEHTMMLILNCARRMNYVQRNFREGNYNLRYTLANTHELYEQTLGIIGVGNIGREVAKKAAHGFGMKVIAYSEHCTQAELDAKGIPITLVESRDKVYSEADYVSIHLPATPDNVGRIGYAEFRKMKPSAYIINTSRGNIIREEEMINALREGIISGAGLDVFAVEPTPADNPLLKMENVVLSPHCAGMTVETSKRLSYLGAQGIVEVLYRKPITYPVNHI